MAADCTALAYAGIQQDFLSGRVVRITSYNVCYTKLLRFLCHISYCYRYRIAARLATAGDSGGCNAGLRVFYDL